MFITGLIFRGSRGLLLSSCRCDSQVRIQAMSLGWCKSPGNPSNQFLPSANGTKDAASKGAQTRQAGQERSRDGESGAAGLSGGERPGREKLTVFAEKRRDPRAWSWVSEERARRDEVLRSSQGRGLGASWT